MAEKLMTETNDPQVRDRVLEAARAGFGSDIHFLSAVFEHGQWWIVCSQCGAQWSVCDAEGPGNIDGFDFDLVFNPNEPCRKEV